MAQIDKELKKLADFHGMDGAETSEIKDAEKQLDTNFAADFSAYLQAFALASANGHELTGLCKSGRLNVVKVTETERERHKDIDPSWYVIERIGIDGALAWQAPDGSIYETTPHSDSVKLCDSLLEYVASDE